MNFKAKWIWQRGADCRAYNQTIIARKQFRLGELSRAVMSITTDGRYRLFINGQWVNDGPGRSWPEHFQYDRIDVTSYLVKGENEIRIVARYFGVGDFHSVPLQAGLLGQLDIQAGKTKRTIATDGSWEVAPATGWIQNTPKVSVQMEPQELYDARLETRGRFTKAAVLFDAKKGPWKDLNPCKVALMTKKPLPFRRFAEASAVSHDGFGICVPATRLLHPGLIEAQRHVSMACGLATVIHLKKAATLCITTDGLNVRAGKYGCKNDRLKLPAGKHLLLATVDSIFDHGKEIAIRFFDSPKMTLENPLCAGHENPWCFIRFPEADYAGDDIAWTIEGDPQRMELVKSYKKRVAEIHRDVTNVESFTKHLGRVASCMPSRKMLLEDFTWQFMNRRVVGDAADCVDGPANLIHDNGDVTVIKPGKQGDVELQYDLGEQSVGYYTIDLVADAGVIIDIHGVEHIDPDGTIKHTVGSRIDNLNGMRYITKQGVNRFVSLKRRSGRYLFITLRNQAKPVRIRNIQLIESTYPVDQQGFFECSDGRLQQVWDISTRTLKLCMEDAYTDCPLYEQTLWVGDARNESLYASTAFGAVDISRRCIQLAAQSLERYDLVGCQVPSCWDCLLPAWSFLWGISVWDHYFYTGDKTWLKKIFPAVLKNLKGTKKHCNEQGLFSGNFWNLFDWAPIDDEHDTVLHNSIFVVGAIDAALQCAEILGDKKNPVWLRPLRSRVIKAVRGLWDNKKKSFPDSIHADGSLSPSTSQHTSFLGVLYDVVEKKNLKHAVGNIIDPPADMVRVGSPFAVQYMYEALEKIGRCDDIIRSIYEMYLPMLQAGATTTWEAFGSSRSHCHAWSAAPLYYLNRIVLGIRQTAPGCTEFEISPHIADGITWARGASASVKGTLSVDWRLEGKTLRVKITAPKSVRARFVRNETHKGLRVIMD
ncbi:MAG: alpha-L-rhamnosidase N-terminal domain-containing protein [Phycisphaerae bacterium]|nr:alpha-L-rhamnosidase N-terminal domain-containing protein [Phycisphaerae bacterium]